MTLRTWSRVRLGPLAAVAVAGASLWAAGARAEPASELTTTTAEAPTPAESKSESESKSKSKSESDAPPSAEPEPEPEPLRGSTSAGLPSAFAVPVGSRDNPYGPRPDDAPRISREQVIRYALENPAIRAAEQNVVAMKAQLRKAKWAWLPVIETVTTLSPGANVACDDLQVDASFLDGGGAVPNDQFQFQWCRPVTGEDTDLNTVQGYFSQLARAGVRVAFDTSAVFPLFTFGKIRNTKRLAQAGVALRRLEVLQAQQETIKLVLQAHTTLLLARESQAILRDAKSVVDKANTRVEADLGGDSGVDDWDSDGSSANSDRDPNDRIKVELAELETEQLMREALRAEALALAALWDLVGAAGPAGFDVAEQDLTPYAIDGGLQPLSEYRALAARERPEAHMARAAIDARRAQEKLARAAFLPDLGLVVTAGVAVSNAVDRDMNRLYYQDRFNYSRITAALALRWRWDFHNTVFDLEKARAELRAQEYQREAAELYLGQDVNRAYADVVEADHRIALSDRATTLSWQLVVSLEQRDTIAGGDAENLLRALKDWYKKRFARAEAIHAHNEAVARLARATGTPLIAHSSPSPASPRPSPATASSVSP